jgi:formylglycine-generating enzyme required for sulfatase activity
MTRAGITMTRAPSADLARIPAGEFLMGSADGDEDERPVHRVHVSEFYIGRCPVTQEEYARFVRATGHPAPAVRALPLVATVGGESAFTEIASRYAWTGDAPPEGHLSHPVVLVRYQDALAYCAWLAGELDRAVRLPTEAEWEKAARGGQEGRQYPWGDEIDPSRCNFLVDPSLKGQRGTRPAGTYPTNGFGLYDMSGNVWEWVFDWYAPGYYATGAGRDPTGAPAGAMRIVRGGSWVNDDIRMLRCAYRHKVPPDTYSYSVGFRIACGA